MKRYRISVRNASNNNRRELMYDIYTSKKQADEMCRKINAIDPERMAMVMVEIK